MFHGNFAGASGIGVGIDELRNRRCGPPDRHKTVFAARDAKQPPFDVENQGYHPEKSDKDERMPKPYWDLERDFLKATRRVVKEILAEYETPDGR